MIRDRVPCGPFTSRTESLSVTVTLAGRAMGFLPTRLISPNVAKHFAAALCRPRFFVGHEALGRGDNGNAHAAVHLLDCVALFVNSEARTGNPLDAGDDGLLGVRVF